MVPLTASTHGNDFVSSVLTNDNGKAKPEFAFQFSILWKEVGRRKKKNNCSPGELFKKDRANYNKKKIVPLTLRV